MDPTQFATIEGQIEALKNAVDPLVEEWNSNKETRAETEKALAEIKSQIEALEQAVKTRPSLPGVEVGKHGERDKWSWGRAIQGFCRNSLFETEEFGYEARVLKEMADKYEDPFTDMRAKVAINAATDAAGGFLIPTEVMLDLLPELEARSIANALGVTTLPSLSGNVKWTKDEGGITVEYIDTENEDTGSESTPSFSAFEMTPHVVGVFIPMTWEMQTQPAIALETWARRRMAAKIALREDLSIFKGTGSNGEPLGVAETPGVNLTALDLSAVIHGRSTASETATGLLRAGVKAVAQADALEGPSLGWAMGVNTNFELAGVYDENGREKFMTAANASAESSSSAMVRNVLGFRAEMTTQLDGGSDDETVIFGPWDRCFLGRWGTLAFAASDETETNFRKLRRTVRGIWAHDVGVSHPEGFVVEKEGLTAFTAS